MYREKYWSSKVPLGLALLFVLNILFVLAAELLFVYKYPARQDAAALARFDSAYESSTVFAQDSRNRLTAALVYTYNDQPHLVVTRAHLIASGRGRIIYAQPVELPESGALTVSVKNGIHTSEILVQKATDDSLSVAFEYAASGGIREYAAIYMLLAALLEGLELLIANLIKRNLM